MPTTGDRICIHGLRLVSSIGVPEEERAVPQSLAVDVEISLSRSFADAGDSIENTLDYFEVSTRLRELASTGRRHLIETLAEELAAAVLAFPGVAKVRLELKKYILADCEYVSVSLTRRRENA